MKDKVPPISRPLGPLVHQSLHSRRIPEICTAMFYIFGCCCRDSQSTDGLGEHALSRKDLEEHQLSRLAWCGRRNRGRRRKRRFRTRRYRHRILNGPLRTVTRKSQRIRRRSWSRGLGHGGDQDSAWRGPRSTVPRSPSLVRPACPLCLAGLLGDRGF